MGTWGAGLFSDDDAADIRDRYRDLLGEGYEGEEATKVILNEWQSEQDNTVFWLALAATQWRCGRLENAVKSRAVQIIDDGADLGRWKEAGDSVQLAKRKSVLMRLRNQLNSNPPPKTKAKKQFHCTCEWELGELISYRLLSGKTVIFRVLGSEGDKGGTWPVCEVLDWQGDSIPNPTELATLPIRNVVDPSLNIRPQLGIGRASASQRDFPEDRIKRMQFKLKPAQQLGMPRVFTLWRFLDATLAKYFALN